MRKGAMVAFAMVAALVLTVSASSAQPPTQPPGKGKGFPGGPGGGFGMRSVPGQIMPAFIQDQLKLTDDQKKQMADLQKELDGKLDKLLTEEQRAQFKQIKDRGAGGKGFPGGFPGGKDGKGKGKGFPPIKKDGGR